MRGGSLLLLPMVAVSRDIKSQERKLIILLKIRERRITTLGIIMCIEEDNGEFNNKSRMY